MRSELRNYIISENYHRDLLQELFTAYNTQNDYYKFHGSSVKTNKRIYSHTVSDLTEWMYFETDKEAYENLKSNFN